VKPLRRNITPRIFEALALSPVVFLNGPRQSGKSTLVYGIRNRIGSKDRPAEYITLDRPVNLGAAASAPEAFLAGKRKPLIIDEVQMAPELFRALKIAVDESRLRSGPKTNGQFLLTGSANILAFPALSDALVGRMTTLTLYPYCTAEASGGKGNGLDRILAMDFSQIKDRGISLTEAIKLATFPEISGLSSKDRMLWFDGYLNTLLQRDVRMLADLQRIALLPGLLRLLATRAGNLINDSDLARSLGLNPVTGKFYRNILQMMFLTFNIDPWFRNFGKRLVKSAKGYLTDTAMLCHLLDMDLDHLAKQRPEFFGHILENYVATEIAKQLSYNETRARLLHFRTSDGKEIDFVLEEPDGSIIAIEVKTSEVVRSDDFSAMRLIAARVEKHFAGGIVLYSGKEIVPFGTNLWAVPLYVLWQ